MFAEIVENCLKEWDLTADPAAIARLKAFCTLLLAKNEVMNLTAAKTEEEVARRHIADSLFLLSCADLRGKRILDLGTGAGFPGLPLKLFDPALDITLLDSRRKRIEFIDSVLEELHIEAETVAARAEDFVGESRGRYDIVTSRAVAPLNILAELSMPFLRTGGLFLPMKSRNESFDTELKNAQKAISILGGRFARAVPYELDGARQVLVIEKVAATPQKYPRKYAQIEKKPL